MSALEKALKRYDGKSTDVLREIRASFDNREPLLSHLVALAVHEGAAVSDGATWLIKDCLDNGVRLTGSKTEELIGGLGAITSWQAQLHVCQSVGHLEVPEHLTETFADWLMPLLTSDRPFLRAWSMDALQHLASRSASLGKRAETALAAAEQDPAASVRARARRWKQSMRRS